MTDPDARSYLTRAVQDVLAERERQRDARPTDEEGERENLVRAAATVIGQIERFDRAADAGLS